jgi:Zn-dependent protease with chaperone function
MSILRTILALVLPFFMYFSYLIFFGKYFDNNDNVWIVYSSFFALHTIAAFISFAISGLISIKRNRYIIFGILLFVLYCIYLYDLITVEKTFWPILGSIMRFSFGAVGAFIGIVITENLGKISYSKMKESSSVKSPGTPISYILLSLFSVPITYIIIFISSLIVLGISSWLLLILFQLPRVPVFLIIAFAFAPLLSFWASIKSLIIIFKPNIGFQPAVLLKINETTKLDKIICEVCEKIKSKKPDYIILHSEPTFFVMQGRLEVFGSKIKGRILAIGAPLLKHLKTNELKAILTHEFSHFTGNDTMYSLFVLPVYKSISTSFENLNKAGGSSITEIVINLLLILPRLCLSNFINYFASIDNIISRKRELRADWIAAKYYGKVSFTEGLKKVTEIGKYFYEQYDKIMDETDSEMFKKIDNMLLKDETLIKEIQNNLFNEKEEIFDSHPKLSTRINAIPDSFSGQSIDNNFDNSLDNFEELEKYFDDLSREYILRFIQIKEFYSRLGQMETQNA